jgi:hypothetical protein
MIDTLEIKRQALTQLIMLDRQKHYIPGDVMPTKQETYDSIKGFTDEILDSLIQQYQAPIQVRYVW